MRTTTTAPAPPHPPQGLIRRHWRSLIVASSMAVALLPAQAQPIGSLNTLSAGHPAQRLSGPALERPERRQPRRHGQLEPLVGRRGVEIQPPLGKPVANL